MSYTDTQTLDDASGDATTYALISRDGTGTVRRNTATTNSEPGLMAIRHSASGKKMDVIDRHLVQFSKTVTDDGGIPRTATVNLSFIVPRHDAITDEMVIDIASNAIDFVSGGGFGDSGITSTATLVQLLRGES